MTVTEFLAIYAAFLSTVVFIWNWAREIPRVKVKIVCGTEKVDEGYLSGVYIFVQNPTPHTVHLAAIHILYLYKKNRSEGADRSPLEIQASALASGLGSFNPL